MYFWKTISLKLKRICFDSEGVFHLWPLRLYVQNHMDRKRVQVTSFRISLAIYGHRRSFQVM